MEIRDVSWDTIEIPLKKPFKIALGTTTVYRGVIVKICTSEFCGLGEASPSPRITGDTVGSIIAALEIMKKILLGKDALDVGARINEIEKAIRGNTAAKAAIDIALHDLLGKRAGLPLYKILGGERKRIDTSLTVSIGNVEETVKHARELLDTGAKVLKVKIGLDPEEDVERIKALRDITDTRIRVDANQGYNLKRALKVLRRIERYEIEFAEQPIPAERIDELEILRRGTEIPIFADESVHRSYDVIRLIGKVDGINIKLMKSGGIREAMKMISIAKAAGMKVMVGCMIETKVGISAGTHFVLGMGADYADLDGYWDLSENPYEGVVYEDGYNILPDSPGLGVKSPGN